LNRLDSNATAFVSHYKHLPISERMILAVERQTSLFGKDGARVAAILKDAGTRNGAAIQHYYGDKDSLIDAAFVYRAQAFNDWAGHFRATLADIDLQLNHLILGMLGAWSYILKQTVPYCYHAGFLQKLHWFSVDSQTARNMTGEMKAFYTDVAIFLKQELGETEMRDRIELGSLQVISAVASKERELRDRLSQTPGTAAELGIEIERYAIELSESVAANLLRERYRPFASDPTELLREADQRSGDAQWVIERIS
jgi:AcrR family transcriptional regulator